MGRQLIMWPESSKFSQKYINHKAEFNSAGTLDSSLTNHGLIQADRLGQFLKSKDYHIRRIFSSDLQRAFLTAKSIDKYQRNDSTITCLKCLREQDFGFYEGKKISSKDSITKSSDNQIISQKNSSTKKVESRKSLVARADLFIDNYLSALLTEEDEDHTIAVVSHGIFLGHFWVALLKRFSFCNIHIRTDLSRKLIGRNLSYLGNWSNTGYLEIDITKNRSFHANCNIEFSPDFDILPCHKTADDGLPQLSGQDKSLHDSNSTKTSETPRDISERLNNRKFFNFFLEVKAINSIDHLHGLQKLRGGTGNLKYDPSQKKIDNYFQKLT